MKAVLDRMFRFFGQASFEEVQGDIGTKDFRVHMKEVDMIRVMLQLCLVNILSFCLFGYCCFMDVSRR